MMPGRGTAPYGRRPHSAVGSQPGGLRGDVHRHHPLDDGGLPHPRDTLRDAEAVARAPRGRTHHTAVAVLARDDEGCVRVVQDRNTA